MGKINILPQSLVNLIAAGEVVERPSSVVKELMENSIDARGTEVILHIEESGKKMIQVKDNGIGMDEEDAKLAFALHATSKIKVKDDLNTISTLGFRGEALASISSVVKKAILETKSVGNPAIKVESSDSKIALHKSSLTANGTEITIFGLFDNVPARKKFLKSDATELKQIIDTFINISLLNNDIHFELYHNKKLLYRLTKTTNIKERFFEIWGKEFAQNLYEPLILKSNICNIEAYLGAPEAGAKAKPIQCLFVNDRFVSDKLVYSALNNAYKGFIHKELKPSYIISIHIDPSKVDVNVHPRKLEIKFSEPSEVYGLIYSSIKGFLEKRTKESLISKFRGESIYKSEEVQERIGTASKKDILRPNSTFHSHETYKPSPTRKQTVSDALTFTKELYTEGLISLKPYQKDSLNSSFGNQIEAEISLLQVFNTYIVLEKDNKVLFVDQHAASEKILFERISQTIGAVKTKPLLVPEIVEFKPHDKALLMEKKDDLQKIGVLIDDFGGNSLQLLEIPEIINSINLKDLLDEILIEDSATNKAYENTLNQSNSLSRELYLLIATTACHGAIRAGQKLTSIEMRNLINDLLKLKNPYNCPHGRPVIWELDRSGIEKNFKRKL